MKEIFFIGFIISLSGCAISQVRMESVKPEWNPPQGYEWAVAQCRARRGDYSFISNISYGKVSYYACMSAYGYELPKGR